MHSHIHTYTHTHTHTYMNTYMHSQTQKKDFEEDMTNKCDNQTQLFFNYIRSQITGKDQHVANHTRTFSVPQKKRSTNQFLIKKPFETGIECFIMIQMSNNINLGRENKRNGIPNWILRYLGLHSTTTAVLLLLF